MRVAIIGAGISGILAARLLSTQHEVTLFEANNYVGGHAHTVDVTLDGQLFSVDTGFMVFNERTYPNFCRMLDSLQIESRPSDMSFGVRCGKTGLEYQGSSLNGLFAQRLNCLRPSFHRMLLDIIRFNRLGRKFAARGERSDGGSVRDFVRECGVGSRFVDQYLVPMASAIWSSSPQAILDFPVDLMLRFFDNHGLMQLRDRPQWRTIVRGSRSYVEKLLEPIADRIRLKSPIVAVVRAEHAVTISTNTGPQESYDEVIFASHADQTLEMLVDATASERKILGAFPYQQNDAVLHTDTRLLPKRRRARASWNYHIPSGENRSAVVTYDLSRLQNHDSPVPILLTLNATAEIDSSKILRTFSYHHPFYTSESFTAQQRFKEISGQNRTHYCGAYWANGFHEDGVNSALAVAKHFGIELDACRAASTKETSRIIAVSR